MAHKDKVGNSFAYTIKRARLLDKPIYLTFDSEEKGDEYVKKLEALLDRNIVPTEYQKVVRVMSLETLVGLYLRDAHVKPKDVGVLRTVCNTVGPTPLLHINAKWVDDWISHMKRVEALAPSTIRSKVGAVARCCDWGMRKGHLLMPDHPLRTLPDGYASYTKLDAALAGKKREDTERDRRLEPGEFERIVGVLDAGVLPRKQRPYDLPDQRALKALFVLALESAMRLRETYTLTVDQVDVAKRTIFLDKTKNGDRRQVPMSSVALATLSEYMKVRAIPSDHAPDALFPWWDGRHDPRYLHDRTDFLSKLFGKIFAEAKCPGLKYHDLRHEATSRLYERTTLTDLQISKITGHRSLQVLRRYANLRGSDLSSRLW